MPSVDPSRAELAALVAVEQELTIVAAAFVARAYAADVDLAAAIARAADTREVAKAGLTARDVARRNLADAR